MSLVESYPRELNGSGQYTSVLPCYGPSWLRVIVTDFEGQNQPLVIYDEQNWNCTEDLEPVEVPSGCFKGFESTAAEYIHPKLKHELFGNDGWKIWSVYGEKKPSLGGVVAFDEEVLACLLAAWDRRGQKKGHATEERIGLRNGQLFWIPKRYPLRDNFGSFKFDLVLKHHEVEALLENLRESVHCFWHSSESKKWKRGSALSELFFGSFLMQLRQLPKHVVCVQLKGIECTTKNMRLRGKLAAGKPVFAPDEVMVMNINALTDMEKRVLCEVASL